MNDRIKFVLAIFVAVAFLITGGPAFAEKVVIKLATGTPKTHPQDQGALFFADMVKKESNGEIEVQVFHSGSLGGHARVRNLLPPLYLEAESGRTTRVSVR